MAVGPACRRCENRASLGPGTIRIWHISDMFEFSPSVVLPPHPFFILLTSHFRSLSLPLSFFSFRSPPPFFLSHSLSIFSLTLAFSPLLFYLSHNCSLASNLSIQTKQITLYLPSLFLSFPSFLVLLGKERLRHN